MWSTDRIADALALRGAEQEALWSRARAARSAADRASVLVRGVVEISNVCRVDCDYCPMRRSNTTPGTTYIMSAEEIVEHAAAVRDANLDVILLQGGENVRSARVTAQALPEVRRLFSGRVEIILNLGLQSTATYESLFAAGADAYIIKQETSDAELHQAVRHEPLAPRLAAIRTLKRIGYRVGIGTISGLPGQSLRSLASELLMVETLGAEMASVSPFIPAAGTPFGDEPAGDLDVTLNALAVMRIMHPDLVVPSVSAFERLSPGGQLAGLMAGANAVTTNFTHATRRARYEIYGSGRFVVTGEHVARLVHASGLPPRGSYVLDPARPGAVAAAGAAR